jgi:RNA polymerase sigma-70 factor (ECF subfamily)
MNTTEEKSLVVLAQQGDEEAFEKLIGLSLPKIKSLLSSHYKLQYADLDDIVQSSMIKVWKKLSSFRNESAFATWFYIILRNEAIDFLKKRNFINSKETSAHYDNEDSEDNDYEHLTPEQIFQETAATLTEKKELLSIYKSMINHVLEELSPCHSQIIKLALEEEKTYKQISELLDIPIGTVMSRLFFARKQARQLIIQYAKRNSIQLNGMGGC